MIGAVKEGGEEGGGEEGGEESSLRPPADGFIGWSCAGRLSSPEGPHSGIDALDGEPSPDSFFPVCALAASASLSLPAAPLL